MTDDESLWKKITADVKKLRVDTIAPIRPKVHTTIRASLPQQIVADLERFHGRVFGFEDISAKKRRQIFTEGTLDLHGFTQAQSEAELRRFLYVSQLQGKIWVKVITGKSGVLRQRGPDLFKKNGALMSAYTEARSEDGGSGAFYVRIRYTEK
jgi:DNA-nicking Smr family endonuclease